MTTRRLNVSLDEQRASKLARLADRAHVPGGTLARSLLSAAIDDADPDAGAITVCGIDARRRPQDVKQRIGAALQTTSLQDKITPREALRLFGSFYRHSAAAEEMLERFALGPKADAPFDSLSGGQRQRLALALAFVNKPELVFLDEPTTGLDPQSRRELHAEVLRMKQDGHTLLLTTHYIEEAEQLCDRIAVIHRGQIIATGAPHELVGRSTAMQTVSLATVPPLSGVALAALPGVQDLVCEGSRARFTTSTVNRTVGDLMSLIEARGVAISDLQVRRATLEDVFIELTGSSGPH